MRYFEDIAVGDTHGFGSYEVTRDEVLDFARKYDPQPFHLSDEGAAGTHFGRLAASGWHSCAMTMAMIVADMQANDTGGLGAAGIDELHWLKPVYPGDVLRVESEVIETRAFRSKPDMGSARTRTMVFNQANEPVMSFLATGLFRRRAPAD